MVEHVLAKDETGVRFSLPAPKNVAKNYKIVVPPPVSRATKVLEDGGFQAYLVGGCVRDLFLDPAPKLGPKDWDIATNAQPEQIVALFPKTFYENRFGTVTVVNEEIEAGPERQIEITPYRQEGKYSDNRHPDEITWAKTIEEDLGRRDFTINAMALNHQTGELIDPYGGLEDLKNKLIRAVGDGSERLAEDPLRILRGIRLAVELGFTIESTTAEAIHQKAELVKTLSAERVRDEFTKIMLSREPMLGLGLAQKLGVLAHFIPELAEGVHVKQNGDHIYDVWEHTLRVAQHAAERGAALEVRLAALFHDVGKPRTREFSQEKGDYTFYGHEVVGAKMAKKILERLKFPVKTTEIVVKLVRNHMFFSDIEKITLSAVRRIIRNVGREHIWDLMEVRMCDRIGMGRPKEESYRLRKYEAMIEEALRAPTSVGMLAINGQDVIRETGLPTGPKIGQILHALLEETLDNPGLNTKEILASKAKELAELSDEELKNRGESGKEAKDEKEEEELAKIRQKFHVK